MKPNNRKDYKTNVNQLEDDRHLDDQIDEFLLQQKLDDERSKDIRDELNEQEEQYLTYLEEKLTQTENRIIETQQLVNNRQIKDEREMKQIKELNIRIQKLLEQKESEKSKFLTQDINEDVKEYVFKLQEENKKLIEERTNFELKYLLRNKQIQILIREIKLYKRNDKYFQDVIMNKDKELQQNFKSMKKLEVGSNDALRRIEFIEKNRQKNIVQLPKMDKQAELQIDNDPFNFWKQDIVSDVIQNLSQKKHTQLKSLKDLIPHEDLWVIEQEKGQKKIDGIEAEKTYAESPETLYQMPHRVQSSRLDDAYKQQQQQNQFTIIKPQSSKPAGTNNSYSMLSALEQQYLQENQNNLNIMPDNQASVNSYPSKLSIKSNQYYADPNNMPNQYQRYQYQNQNQN